MKSQKGIEAEEYFHQDRVGSVVLSTQATVSGTIKMGHAAYDPYGLEVTAASWGPNTLTVPYRFAGARLDLTDLDYDNTPDNAGLYLMGARWYDPEMGRFLEQDPLGEEGGLNLYAYTGSSPILWVDPSGLRAEPTSSDRIIAEAESAARDKHAEFNDWVAQGDTEARAREEAAEETNPNPTTPTPEHTPDGSQNQPPTTGTDTNGDGTPDSAPGTSTENTTPPDNGASEKINSSRSDLPPGASLVTDMTDGTTTLTLEYPDGSSIQYIAPSSNAVTSNSSQGAQNGFITFDVNGISNAAPASAYGPSGAYLDTGNERGFDIHGGGTGLGEKSGEPNQPLLPTLGCTRMHNEDVQAFHGLIDKFKEEYNQPVLNVRFGTPPNAFHQDWTIPDDAQFIQGSKNGRLQIYSAP